MNSTADNIESINNSLDEFNANLEKQKIKLSITASAKKSKLNCLMIKKLPPEIISFPSEQHGPLNRIYNFFEECAILCEKVEKSDAATNLVLSSPELSYWFFKIKNMTISEDGYSQYLIKITKSGKLMHFEENPENRTISNEFDKQIRICSEHIFINSALQNHIPETFNLKDLEVEIDKLFQEKSIINNIIFKQ